MEKYYITSTKFSLRERKLKGSGKVVYDVIFRVYDAGMRPRQKVLSGYTSKTLASRAHADFIASSCDLLTEKPEPAKEVVTIGKLYPSYLAFISSTQKESSQYALRSAFTNHILPTFKDRDVQSIEKGDLYRWQDELISFRKKNGEPFSYAHVKTVRNFFNAFLNWVETRYDIKNPLKNVPFPKAYTSRARAKKDYTIWEVEDFDKFIGVVEDPMYHALFTLLFWCGCRMGEAFSLTRTDYNGETLRINKTVSKKTLDGSSYKVTQTKARRDNTLPVARRLKDELDAYVQTIKSGDFLFGGDRPLPDTSVRRAFYKYQEAAGVPHVKIHELRHSFVSMCIHHGANYMVVAELIGDTPEQVLQTYGHFWQSDKAKIVSLL